MDRKPLPAPFAEGATLRYVGTSRVTMQHRGRAVPVVAPGLVVTVVRTYPGRQGTLRMLSGAYQDIGHGAPALDCTEDGFSLYEVPVSGGKPFGRIIWPANAHEWEQV